MAVAVPEEHIQTPAPLAAAGAELGDAALVAAWVINLQLHEGLSPATVATYRLHLKAFRAWLADAHPSLGLAMVERPHVRAFLLAEAVRGLAPITRSTELFSVRSFYRWLVAEEMTEVDPTEKVTVPGADSQRTLIYTDHEADAICAWAQDQASLRWDVGHAVLCTFRYTGLRLGELLHSRMDRLDLSARRLSVVGKGDKPRMVPIPPVLAPTLERYLKDVRPTLPDSPYVFVNPLGYDHGSCQGRYGAVSLEALVRAAGTGAGVTERHFPHRWRHTYATSLLRRGVDIHKVQRLLGHAKIVTTIRYMHLSDADLADAVDLAFPELS